MMVSYLLSSFTDLEESMLFRMVWGCCSCPIVLGRPRRGLVQRVSCLVALEFSIHELRFQRPHVAPTPSGCFRSYGKSPNRYGPNPYGTFSNELGWPIDISF